MPEADEPKQLKIRKPFQFKQGQIILFTRGKCDTYTEAGLGIALRDLDQAELVPKFRQEVSPVDYVEGEEIATFVAWLASRGYIDVINYDVWYLGRRHECFTYKHNHTHSVPRKISKKTFKSPPVPPVPILDRVIGWLDSKSK